MDQKEIEHFVEAALLAAGRPLSIDQIQGLFDGRSTPEKSTLREAIQALNDSYSDRGIVIGEVASGFRLQIRQNMADRLNKLWEERPPRYSRALFETLALIAYRQPITRGEIEEIRGVAVSSNIMRSLVEREWVRVVGHRDVPGRPAMFGTTKAFLDYFSLKKLDDLPELSDLSDWESLRVQLDLPDVDGETANDANGGGSVTALPIRGEDEAFSEEAEPASADGSNETVSTDDREVAETPRDAVADDVGDDENAELELPELTALEDDADAGSSEDLKEDSTSESSDGVDTDAIPELVEGADDEELVVSEWPSPGTAEKLAEFESRSPDESKDS